MAVKSADGLKTTVREGEQILLRPGGVGGRLSVLRQDYFFQQFKTYRYDYLIYHQRMFDSDEDRDPSYNPFHHVNNVDSIFQSYCSPAIFLEEQPRESSNSITTKTRKIQKHKQSTKRPTRTTFQQSFGRPPNKDPQRSHLQESRSFNDLLYHYARLLILLKLKQDKQPAVHSLHLQNQENKLMSQTFQIMNRQTFPKLTDNPPAFSLHSNSLHYVFKHHREVSRKKKYSSTELKIMFLAFLSKKKILSSAIYQYLNNYWTDIIHLVTHPDGDLQSDSQISSQLANPGKDRSESVLPAEKVSRHNQSQVRSESSGSGEKSRSGRKGEASEVKQLMRELQEDDTIVAYEIASYLHCCCKKFRLFIQEYK